MAKSKANSKLQNVKAIKEMLAGKHKTQTRKSFGFTTSAEPTRKVGDEWIETNANGTKIKVTQKKIVRMQTPNSTANTMITPNAPIRHTKCVTFKGNPRFLLFTPHSINDEVTFNHDVYAINNSGSVYFLKVILRTNTQLTYKMCEKPMTTPFSREDAERTLYYSQEETINIETMGTIGELIKPLNRPIVYAALAISL